MGTKIRVGLIGCGGNMRKAHLPRIKAVRDAQLVTVSDPLPEAAQQIIETWGKLLTVYGDYRQMLRQEDLDAVIISTPHSQHIEQARAALNRKLHVLVEKPLTIKAAHARALLQLAQKHDRVLHVAYQRHHQPEYAHVRQLIARGALGEVRSVIGYVTQAWGVRGGWRCEPELSGGGMFMDTGSHLVAAVFFTTGLKARHVAAVVDCAGQPVDINTAVSVGFESGAVGSISTIGNAACHDERLAIHGSEGCIVMHQHRWQLKSLLLNDEPMQVPRSLTPDTPDAAFFRWIRCRDGYEPPDYAIQVARFSEAVYESAVSGRRIRVRR
jgi:predicted dehydrogenase